MKVLTLNKETNPLITYSFTCPYYRFDRKNHRICSSIDIKHSALTLLCPAIVKHATNLFFFLVRLIKIVMLAQDSFIYIVEVNPINKIWHMSFWNSAITSYFQIAQLFFLVSTVKRKEMVFSLLWNKSPLPQWKLIESEKKIGWKKTKLTLFIRIFIQNSLQFSKFLPHLFGFLSSHCKTRTYCY